MSATDNDPKILFSSHITRVALRQWIQAHAFELESAQAVGTLARTKLDLKDVVESELPFCPPDEKAKYEKIFKEELEAFCADMRFASVTVQSQVERKTGFPIGRLIGAFALAAVSTVILIIIAGAVGGQNGDSGLGSVILLGAPPLLTFFFFQMMAPPAPKEKPGVATKFN
jgi:hypothetical protein